MLHIRLAAILIERSMSQGTLARITGVPQCVISLFLGGKRPGTRTEVVVRLARGLGLTPAQLGKLLYDVFPVQDSEVASKKISEAS